MGPAIGIVLGALILIPLGIVAVLYLIVPLFKALGWIVRQVFRFVIGEVGDCLRIVGSLITQLVLFPLVIVNVLIGRWSAAGHYGRALKSEFRATLGCVYRIAIGHPARLFCLTALTDGLEHRIPEVIAAAPTADRPNPRTTGQFEGYRIIGSLPGGGSGGKLYVAEPDELKLAVFARNGRPDIRQVVIKTFSLRDGSSLPQIVRESRALEAAKRLGLVLEHELSNERFYYVTQYMPGESLSLVTQRLHAMSGGEGLADSHLRSALAYTGDLLRTLDGYHRGGLWHKDVKPDNIIVDGRSAHLVDFGLVTPLRSGMTLTTHGTEYFRDPEMVRLALKGVKVHQVDGAKFDIYGAGAVLFSLVENSFPAHGGLSQISRRCPEALRWIVRRAMTDYDKRYPSAAAMLADVELVLRAADPFAVKPIDLPSMRGAEIPAAAMDRDEPLLRPAFQPFPVGAGSNSPGYGGAAQVAAAATPVSVGERRRPRLRVNRWWTGGYVVEDGVPESVHGAHRVATTATPGVGYGGFTPVADRPARAQRGGARLSAREQVEKARERVRAARERAQGRMAGRRGRVPGEFQPLNAGVGFAAFMFVGMCIAATVLVASWRSSRSITSVGPVPGVSFAHFDIPDAGDMPEPPTPPAPAGDLGAAIREAQDAMREAATSAVVKSNKGLPAPRIIINGATVDGGAPLAATPMAHGERVLVISDVVPATAGINAAVGRLREAGFEILGNVPGAAEDQTTEIELEATAKGIRGLARLDDSEAAENLSRWLADSGEVELLVWFTRVEPEKPGVQCFVYSPLHEQGDDQEIVNSSRAVLKTGVWAVTGRK